MVNYNFLILVISMYSVYLFVYLLAINKSNQIKMMQSVQV